MTFSRATGQFSFYQNDAFGHVMPFRPVGKKPVRGGRWKVRKFRFGNPQSRWRAWSDGSASVFNRRFATHSEAVGWATRVAAAIEVGTPDSLLPIIREHRPRADWYRVDELIQRFARKTKTRSNA